MKSEVCNPPGAVVITLRARSVAALKAARRLLKVDGVRGASRRDGEMRGVRLERRQVDLADARHEIGYRVVASYEIAVGVGRVDKDIRPTLSPQGVGPGTAGHPIGSAVAYERIGIRTTDQVFDGVHLVDQRTVDVAGLSSEVGKDRRPVSSHLSDLIEMGPQGRQHFLRKELQSGIVAGFGIGLEQVDRLDVCSVLHLDVGLVESSRLLALEIGEHGPVLGQQLGRRRRQFASAGHA